MTEFNDIILEANDIGKRMKALLDDDKVQHQEQINLIWNLFLAGIEGDSIDRLIVVDKDDGSYDCHISFTAE